MASQRVRIGRSGYDWKGYAPANARYLLRSLSTGGKE